MIAIRYRGEKREHPSKVKINTLPTGVPGLDEIVGGGLPEFSFNIIAGAPGSGKTTLAHQIVFANATPEHPALYFTVLGESAIKILRRSLKSARKPMRSGPPAWVWIWKRRRKTVNSHSFICVPWISPWMRPCTRYLTQCRKLAPSA